MDMWSTYATFCRDTLTSRRMVRACTMTCPVGRCDYMLMGEVYPIELIDAIVVLVNYDYRSIAIQLVAGVCDLAATAARRIVDEVAAGNYYTMEVNHNDEPRAGFLVPLTRPD